MIDEKSYVINILGDRCIDLWPYLSRAAIEEDDIIIVSGTLIEGIGNEFSDIDIYVLTESYRKFHEIPAGTNCRLISTKREIMRGDNNDDVLLVHLPVSQTGIKIDIEYKTLHEFEILAREIDELYSYAVKTPILLTKTLPERIMSFVHRMHNAICIKNKSRLDQIQKRINRTKFNYLLYRWNASDYADFLDLVGAWRQGEIVRCMDLARENMIKQTQAYMFLLGCTDYKRKWIIARMHEMNFAANLTVRFEELFLCRDVSDYRKYVLDTLEFVDEIFCLSGKFFSDNTNLEFPAGESVVAWIDERIRLTAQTYEIYELKYRRKAYVPVNFLPAVGLLEELNF